MFKMQKPVIPARYLKGQVVESKGQLFESLKRPDDTYFWHPLSHHDTIDETSTSMFPTKNNMIGHHLETILKEIRANPNYKITTFDYDSFYLYRVRFPLFWNTFLSLYQARRL